MKDTQNTFGKLRNRTNKLVICRKDQLPEKNMEKCGRIKEDINTLQEKVA